MDKLIDLGLVKNTSKNQKTNIQNEEEKEYDEQ